MKKTVIILICLCWQVATWGGNLNNGANDGLLYAHFNNSSGNSNANIGSQLSLNKNLYAAGIIAPALAEKYKFTYTVSTFGTLYIAQANVKRHSNLYNKVCDYDNILLAYHNAKKGKRNYREVKQIEKNPDLYLKQLQQTLLSNTFKNSEYKIFEKFTGSKIRVIYKLPFYPDRIVHHCIVQILQPIWMNLLIRDTYSTIPGRGIHDGVNRIKSALKDIENTQYCLKLDVKKYYPSIDHTILENIVQRKVKDPQLLNLISPIINSAPGIPIGNYISQWFGNLYLAYFDHFVKEQLKCKYYYRYCDDMVLLSSDKAQLWQWKDQIQQYLSDNLKLNLKENYQVFPVKDRGIDFLGYKFFHTHTLVRKSIVKNFKKKINNKKTTKQTQSAYWGWFKHADTFNLICKYFNNESIKVKKG